MDNRVKPVVGWFPADHGQPSFKNAMKRWFYTSSILFCAVMVPIGLMVS